MKRIILPSIALLLFIFSDVSFFNKKNQNRVPASISSETNSHYQVVYPTTASELTKSKKISNKKSSLKPKKELVKEIPPSKSGQVNLSRSSSDNSYNPDQDPALSENLLITDGRESNQSNWANESSYENNIAQNDIENNIPMADLPNAQVDNVNTGESVTYGVTFPAANTPAEVEDALIPTSKFDQVETEDLKLFGKIPPLQNLITSSSSYMGALAATCIDPKIKLFEIETMTILADNPLSLRDIEIDTSFSFSPKELKLDTSNPTKYMLKTEGCEESYERVVTSFSKKQDLTLSTTVISKVVKSSIESEHPIQDIEGTKIDKLVDQLEEQVVISNITNIKDAYSQIDEDSFKEVFPNKTPDLLLNSLPDVTSITIQSSIDEGVNAEFSATATHWSGVDYTVAYEWEIDGVIHTGTAVNYWPPANSKRLIPVTLRIGKADLGGNLIKNDPTAPYHQIAYNISVNDTIEAAAPLIELNASSPTPTSTRSIQVNINTGMSLENCDSFSDLAITENNQVPVASDFTISCDTANIQVLNYDITSIADGDIQLKLWARDINNKISTIPSELTINLDTTAPQIIFEPLSSYYLGNNNAIFRWNMTEANSSSSQNFTVSFYNGSSWSALPDTPVTDGPHIQSPFQTVVTLPNFNTTQAKLRVSYSDLLGQSTTVETNNFEIRVPTFDFIPTSHNFGAHKSQTESSEAFFTFSNTGAVIGSNCIAPQIFGTNLTDFVISSNTCIGQDLAPGESCTIGVKSSPQTKGAKTAELTMSCDGYIKTSVLTSTSLNNEPEVASELSIVLNEDIPYNFAIAQASDIDNDTLTYTVVTAPAHGSLVGCLQGTTSTSCQYLPNADYNGTDSFTYKASDGINDSLSVTTVNVTINPMNDVPVMIGNQSISLNEDSSTSFTLNGATDIDLPAQELQYKIITPPTKGVLQNCIATGTYGTDLSCDYIANSNQTGVDSFTYLANDGLEDSLTIATVTITIAPVNDAPTLIDGQSVSIQEDVTTVITLNQGSDIDLDTLTYIIASSPSHGTLSCTGGTSRDCSYTSTSNYNGPDSFTYKVNDGTIDSNIVTVTIDVTPVNDAPTVPLTQTVSTNEDTLFNFTLNLGADIDGDTVTYKVTNPPSEGTLTCTEGLSNNCSYTPAQNSTTSVTFNYVVNDGQLDSNTATVTINITSVNDAPIMTGDQNETLQEDTPYNFTLSGATDIDLPGDTISYMLITSPTHGTLSSCITTGSWSTDITCVYTPSANYNGIDSFTYRANDGNSDSATISTVYITVTPVNDAPTLPATQAVSGSEDTVLNFTLNAGGDIENDPLFYSVVSTTASGTLSCPGGGDRACTYTPSANENGTFTFTYKVNDGEFDSNISTVTITLASINDAPTNPVDQSIAVNEDSSINFDLLQGTDLDTAQVSLQYKLVSAPSNGTLTNCIGAGSYSSDLSCTYTPNSNYNGGDSFTYITNDGLLDATGVTTVTITVTPTNDAPTIPATQSISVNEDESFTFDLNAGSDIDGDTLSYVIVTSPSSGTLSCTGGNSSNCTYTSALDNNGTVTFEYKVNDGSSDSNIATVTVTINPINDAPIAPTDQNISVSEDSFIDFTLQEGTDIDTALASLQYKIVTQPSNGSLTNCITDSSYGSDRTCTYAPSPDFNGTDTFTYIVNDSEFDSIAFSTVTITVNATNDAPVMVLDQVETIRDNADLNFTLNGATDIDQPAQIISYKLVSAPTNGTLTNCISTDSYSTDITCTYHSNANFNGTDSFTYLANDGVTDSISVSTVTITVTDLTPTPAPALTIEGGAVQNTNNLQLTISSCTDVAQVLINDGTSPSGAEAEWTACSTAIGNYNFTTAATNQSHSIFVWAKDPQGNISSSAESTSYIYDDIAPGIAFKPRTQYAANTTQLVEWYMSETNSSSGQTIQIRFYDGSTWSNLPSAMSKDGPLSTTYFSTEFTTPSTDGMNGILEVSYTDLAGNNTTIQKNILIDGGAPTITSIDLNSGATIASNNNLSISLSANDTASKITSVCLKYNDITPPAESDSCWFSLLAELQATSINIAPTDNVFFRVGFSFGTYIVSAWVKDEAGNISNYTDTVGVDKKSIDYNPGTPPVVNNVIAVNNDNPTFPLSYSDLSFTVGQDVYIKWNASDAEGLIANPISLYYTIDNVNFTLITDGIANAQGSGCTIDADHTGCYVWSSGAPTTEQFKIRVVVEDTSNITSIAISPPTNQISLSVIAGNTEKGIGGSAASAIFDVATSTYETNRNAIVVANDGTVFFRDRNGNLLYVDPATGNLNFYIPKTGTSSGDGGPVSSATIKEARGINLDHQGRLLIWDFDLIRRVDLNAEPPTIETIIGGGSSDTPGTVVPANGIRLDPYDYWYGTFIPLPNGDIYFKSNSDSADNRYRVYRSSSNQVEEILTQGPGIYGTATEDWSLSNAKMLTVAYDPVTSDITHMHVVRDRPVVGNILHRVARLDFANGSPSAPYQAVAPFNIYAGYRYRSNTQLDGYAYFLGISGRHLRRYHPETNTYTNVLGTGVEGPVPCDDGTAALSCSVRIQSYFVTRQGKLYFIDRGLIRTLDDSGNVVTLMGQFKSAGNGGNALSARIGAVYTINFGTSYDKIIFGDYLSGDYREITIGGNIEYITGGSASRQYNVTVDPITGDIFDGTGTYVRRFVRATETWENVVGGGAIDYSVGDGNYGTDLKFDWYTAQILGYDGTNLLVHKSRWDGDSSSDAFIKLYDTTNSYLQSQFMGIAGDSLSYPTIGNDSTLNKAISYGGYPQAHWNSTLDRWLIGSNWSYDNIIWAIPNGGGVIEQFAALPRTKDGFGIRQNGADTYIYYCSDGRLWEYNQTTSVERKLDWSSGISCLSSAGQILYHPTRNSLIFIYIENNLYGIAEFKL